MMDTKTIGNRIAEARKKIHISQAGLAERLFISSQAVGKWERGESMPDITTFNRLAEILGVDLNYFSENFPSAVDESTALVPSVKRPDELPAAKQKIKRSWDMSRGNWVDADFSGLKNLHEKFSASNMQRCLFVGSDLSGLLLKGNNIASCDLSGSDLGGSRIHSSYLANNIFKSASLIQAEFKESYISGCDFSGADFTGVLFKSGGIAKSIVVNAIWNRTSFIASQLADMVFEGTLEDCCFENCSFAGVTFRNAILINTFYKCRSLKRIRFIDCHADRMTHAFLKNGKADLSGITMLDH